MWLFDFLIIEIEILIFMCDDVNRLRFFINVYFWILVCNIFFKVVFYSKE